MKRRQFLRHGLGALALTAGPHLLTRRARGQSVSGGVLPADPPYSPAARPRPEYEILLSGGLSALESFYVMADRAASRGGPWFGARSVVDTLDWSGYGPSLGTAERACRQRCSNTMGLAMSISVR
jgi:hypothetical protein